MDTEDKTPLALPEGYVAWVRTIAARIRGARYRAALAANAELIRLYHDIGREILDRRQHLGWGAKVVEWLARDLRRVFPDMKGFSARNLKYMANFAMECPTGAIGQQAAAQLPWFHVVTILTRLSDPGQREWYARHAVAEGWSRELLVRQIESKVHLRQGAAVTNFPESLGEPEAGLVTAILKDPYHFDFLGLTDEAQERDIEGGLLRHLTRFLLELGAGFAFVGRQVRLEVGGEEYVLDLLLYHIRLKRFVVVEVKAGDFQPEHAGKVNFYRNAIDAQMKGADDGRTIGLLLCRRRNRIVAEYALGGLDGPIGVAQYELVRALPASLDGSLPSIEAIEAELARGWNGRDDAEGVTPTSW